MPGVWPWPGRAVEFQAPLGDWRMIPWMRTWPSSMLICRVSVSSLVRRVVRQGQTQGNPVSCVRVSVPGPDGCLRSDRSSPCRRSPCRGTWSGYRGPGPDPTSNLVTLAADLAMRFGKPATPWPCAWPDSTSVRGTRLSMQVRGLPGAWPGSRQPPVSSVRVSDPEPGGVPCQPRCQSRCPAITDRRPSAQESTSLETVPASCRR